MCDNASLLQWQPSAVFYLNPAIVMSGTDPLAFSRAYVVWLPQSWLGWHAPMAAAGLVGQALDALLQKPLHPFIDMATADPNRRGNGEHGPPRWWSLNAAIPTASGVAQV